MQRLHGTIFAGEFRRHHREVARGAFFVRKDLTKDLFLEPATAEEHYEPLRTFFSHLQSGHPPQPGVYLTV